MSKSYRYLTPNEYERLLLMFKVTNLSDLNRLHLIISKELELHFASDLMP